MGWRVPWSGIMSGFLAGHRCLGFAMTFGLFGTFVAADGQRDELVRHLLGAAALLHDDPACLQYIVGTHGDREVSIFEHWDDEAAHDASLHREDIRGIINVARPLIATMALQIRLEVHGGKVM